MEVQKSFIIINGLRFDKNINVRRYGNNMMTIYNKYFKMKLFHGWSEWKKPSQLTKTKNMLRYYYYEKK
jgi:hypothetical protein